MRLKVKERDVSKLTGRPGQEVLFALDLFGNIYAVLGIMIGAEWVALLMLLLVFAQGLCEERGMIRLKRRTVWTKLSLKTHIHLSLTDKTQ